MVDVDNGDNGDNDDNDENDDNEEDEEDVEGGNGDDSYLCMQGFPLLVHHWIEDFHLKNVV